MSLRRRWLFDRFHVWLVDSWSCRLSDWLRVDYITMSCWLTFDHVVMSDWSTVYYIALCCWLQLFLFAATCRVHRLETETALWYLQTWTGKICPCHGNSNDNHIVLPFLCGRQQDCMARRPRHDNSLVMLQITIRAHSVFETHISAWYRAAPHNLADTCVSTERPHMSADVWVRVQGQCRTVCWPPTCP